MVNVTRVLHIVLVLRRQKFHVSHQVLFALTSPSFMSTQTAGSTTLVTNTGALAPIIGLHLQPHGP